MADNFGPGKQLVTAYPACVFFVSGSLAMFRFVPRYMACMMAFLHPARSKGEVSSSRSC